MQIFLNLDSLPQDLTFMYMKVGALSLENALSLACVSVACNALMRQMPASFWNKFMEGKRGFIPLNKLCTLVITRPTQITSFIAGRVFHQDERKKDDAQEIFCSLLNQLTHLQRLDLGGIAYGDVLLSNIQHPDKIKRLNLSHTRISKDALELLLPKLTSIEDLSLCKIDIDDNSLHALPNKTELKALAIRSRAVSKNIVELFEREFKALKTLQIHFSCEEGYRELLSTCSGVTKFVFPYDTMVTSAEKKAAIAKGVGIIIESKSQKRMSTIVGLSVKRQLFPRLEGEPQPKRLKLVASIVANEGPTPQNQDNASPDDEMNLD